MLYEVITGSLERLQFARLKNLVEKLYEKVPFYRAKLDATRRIQMGFLPRPEDALAGEWRVAAGALIRITSYNVCYTKLLRDPHHSITVNRKSSI